MASIYFIPGFDPVGPYRYITIFRDALRNLHPTKSVHIRGCPAKFTPTDEQCGWSSFVIAQQSSNKKSGTRISIANYTDVIRGQWNYRPFELIYASLVSIAEFVNGGFLHCWTKDFRSALLSALTFFALQAVWLIPSLIVGGLYFGGSALTAHSATKVIVLLPVWMALVWYAWSIIVHFKLDWLFKAILFQRKLSRPTDNSLNAAAIVLADQISANEPKHSLDKIYLVSHSSGFSLLLLVFLVLKETQGSNILDRIIVITYGRSLPLSLAQNRLNTALSVLLSSPKTRWHDIVSQEDFLCDALLLPNQYMIDEHLSRCRLSTLDYSFVKSEGPISKITRPAWLLINQYDIHFKYLTAACTSPSDGENVHATMPRLIWGLIKPS